MRIASTLGETPLGNVWLRPGSFYPVKDPTSGNFRGPDFEFDCGKEGRGELTY